jgi:hypothetical protein
MAFSYGALPSYQTKGRVVGRDAYESTAPKSREAGSTVDEGVLTGRTAAWQLDLCPSRVHAEVLREIVISTNDDWRIP